MTADRRPYRRESEESRRDALISAALELLAEGGPQAATIRAIAERAGVTPGLIRHYFSTKDELTRTAYGYLMDRMTNSNAEVLQSAPDNPGEIARADIMCDGEIQLITKETVDDGQRVKQTRGSYANASA